MNADNKERIELLNASLDALGHIGVNNYGQQKLRLINMLLECHDAMDKDYKERYATNKRRCCDC